jgi:hypothetical protein
METEDLYISLYEGFSPTAEYIQADSPHRNFLLEGAIIAGLAFALKAFAESFFESLGEAAAKPVIDRIKARFKKSEESCERDAMLEALELMAPYLKHLAEMTEKQRVVYQSAVTAALGTRGYPPDVADETAAKVMISLVAAGEVR